MASCLLTTDHQALAQPRAVVVVAGRKDHSVPELSKLVDEPGGLEVLVFGSRLGDVPSHQDQAVGAHL